MGVVLSKLRGKKDGLKEQLEKVEKELKGIRRFQLDTELSQKRTIGRIVLYSSILYVGAAVGLYFFVERTDWRAQVLCVLPLILLPILFYLVNRSMKWYYKRKLTNNTDRYRELKQEKQRLLEDVMEFETFNNAKEILAKYDPDKLLPKYLDGMKSMSMSPTQTPLAQSQSATDHGLRQRQIPIAGSTPIRRNPGLLGPGQTPVMRPILGGTNPPGQFLRQPANPFPLPVRRALLPAPGPNNSTPLPLRPQVPMNPMNSMMHSAHNQPTPRYMVPLPPRNPILENRSQGWMDKLVDYFVGDGPANRYALICRYCASHNGLATPEDFPYVGYRCACCHQFNPPRKIRPTAQKLETNGEGVTIDEMETSTTGTGANDSTQNPVVTYADSSVAGSESGDSDAGGASAPETQTDPETGAGAGTGVVAESKIENPIENTDTQTQVLESESRSAVNAELAGESEPIEGQTQNREESQEQRPDPEPTDDENVLFIDETENDSPDATFVILSPLRDFLPNENESQSQENVVDQEMSTSAPEEPDSSFTKSDETDGKAD